MAAFRAASCAIRSMRGTDPGMPSHSSPNRISQLEHRPSLTPWKHGGNVASDRGEAGRTGRALALDIGERTIGVAVSDPLGLTGQPAGEIRRTSLPRDLDAIRAMVAEHGATVVVVGLPRSLNGSLGPQARKVQEFVARLREAIPQPITFWDERFSTAMAERALIAADVRRAERRRVVDRVAAAVILQSYLDAQAHRGAEHRTDVDGRDPAPAASAGRGDPDGA
jgi:putative Holliday junction resolvase